MMSPLVPPRPLILSIDLERFYPAVARPFHGTPVPELVERFLALLRGRAHATFFVVGETAREHPALLERIAGEEHELACHGDAHRTLDTFSPTTFAADLRANRAAVENAAGVRVRGFRAPLFSLTAAAAWAHRVLADEGFSYSSSVLPAHNPLFGWPEFGRAPRMVDGVLEIPITTARIPGTGAELPLFGGTYFRVLPGILIRRALTALPADLPLQSYFHPYDIDAAQPWTMHAGVRGRRWMNLLLFLRRRSLPSRLRAYLATSGKGLTYSAFLAQMHASI